MNPVIRAQAHTLQGLLRDPKKNDVTKAHLFLEQTHLPYDVQDLIFAALAGMKKLDESLVQEVLEDLISDSSFDERLLH